MLGMVFFLNFLVRITFVMFSVCLPCQPCPPLLDSCCVKTSPNGKNLTMNMWQLYFNTCWKIKCALQLPRQKQIFQWTLFYLSTTSHSFQHIVCKDATNPSQLIQCTLFKKLSWKFWKSHVWIWTTIFFYHGISRKSRWNTVVLSFGNFERYDCKLCATFAARNSWKIW